MNPSVYIRHEAQLRAAGIPWRDPRAVFRCARRLNSGAAYLAASMYLRERYEAETFRDARAVLYDGARRLNKWYLQCAHEAR